MEGRKQYNFTRFVTPDLTKAKICLLLTYARESGFSGTVEFVVRKDVADLIRVEGGLEEIMYGENRGYVHDVKIKKPQPNPHKIAIIEFKVKLNTENDAQNV